MDIPVNEKKYQNCWCHLLVNVLKFDLDHVDKTSCDLQIGPLNLIISSNILT